MNNELLRKLQLTELEILKDIHCFCQANDIKYSLHYGSLLGAVRHKGFIPWDDDLDICMDRNNYEKFLSLWEQSDNKNYYLQSTRIGAKTTINHTKIRKNNTVLATKDEYSKQEHSGIWVDVFSIDKVPNKRIALMRMYFWSALRLVYTRNYPMRNNGKILEFISKILLCLPSFLKSKIKNHSEKYVARYKDLDNDFVYVDLAKPDSLRKYIPKEMFSGFQLAEFESVEVYIVSHFKEFLTLIYGDYMQLPPKEDRVCKHSPEILIFNTEESNSNDIIIEKEYI